MIALTSTSAPAAMSTLPFSRAVVSRGTPSGAIAMSTGRAQ